MHPYPTSLTVNDDQDCAILACALRRARNYWESQADAPWRAETLRRVDALLRVLDAAFAEAHALACDQMD